LITVIAGVALFWNVEPTIAAFVAWALPLLAAAAALMFVAAATTINE